MSRTEPTRRRTILDPRRQSDIGIALLVRGAKGAVTIHDVPAQSVVLVGRDEPADVLLDDVSVSRKHARILAGTPLRIEDLGSTNGTRVMGHPLKPGETVAIAIGNVIEFGSVVAFVHAKGDDAANVPVAFTPRAPKDKDKDKEPSRDIVVRDTAMRELYNVADIIAPSMMTVLILGETGVGKDVYAETIHARSARAGGPFLRLNCAALPEALLEGELFGYERGAFTGAINAKAGLFESADGGTVFLDEVGELSPSTQAKLLRVLENGEVMRLGALKSKRVDVRFVSATNRDLEVLAAAEKFRSDLFFRLNGVAVTIPPLRKRKEDLVALAEHFARVAAQKLGRGATTLSPAAMDRLLGHRWPGNIRELRNVVERAVLMARGGSIEAADLAFRIAEPEPAPAPKVPDAAPSGGNIKVDMAALEKQRILDVLDQCGGNQSRAAKVLGIARGTLVKRLEAYGVARPRK